MQRLCPGSLLLINLLPVAGMFMEITPPFRAVSPPVNSKFRHKTVIFIIFHQNNQKHGMNFIIFNAIFRVARRGKYGIIKTDEPRTLDFSGVRGFLVTNVCIVQRSAA